MRLTIIRGPSGTGKSTIARYIKDYWAKNSTTQLVICEADDYFINERGEYYRDVTKLQLAHRACYLKAKLAMENKQPVVISDTSIKRRDIRGYIMLAESYNYGVEIIRTPGPWDPNELTKRNKHRVPLEAIKRQIDRYQQHEREFEWKVMDIFKHE